MFITSINYEQQNWNRVDSSKNNWPGPYLFFDLSELFLCRSFRMDITSLYNFVWKMTSDPNNILLFSKWNRGIKYSIKQISVIRNTYADCSLKFLFKSEKNAFSNLRLSLNCNMFGYRVVFNIWALIILLSIYISHASCTQ